MRYHAWIYPAGTGWRSPTPVEKRCRTCGLRYWNVAREHFWEFEYHGERVVVGPNATNRLPVQCVTAAARRD